MLRVVTIGILAPLLHWHSPSTPLSGSSKGRHGGGLVGVAEGEEVARDVDLRAPKIC